MPEATDVSHVGVLLSSRGDAKGAEAGFAVFGELAMRVEVRLTSAGDPEGIARTVIELEQLGVKAFLVVAGSDPFLPGLVAGRTLRPVVALPLLSYGFGDAATLATALSGGPFRPVTAVAVGGAEQAALAVARIVALADADLAGRVAAQKAGKVALAMAKAAQSAGIAD